MGEASFRKLFSEENARKTFQKVFNERTVKVLHDLASKGYFDQVEFVVSTGKEAHVFRAKDKAGNYKAVKIYKVETSNFKQMERYIAGDTRFKSVPRDKRSIVWAWAKKEFKNLDALSQAGIRVPLPFVSRENVLVMEFIGRNGKAALTLKEKPCKDIENVKRVMIEWLARMALHGIIHGDLSEYNILNNEKELVLIDCGQAILSSHPMAKSFFERDVMNAAKYLSRKGLHTSFEDLFAEVKEKKQELKESL